jgi:O-acetyl-ADP-ribose deacetylase (regulator of RNase III)
MIRYVSGDIRFSQADAIAHGVAPNDAFDQGLAFALHEAVPAMYKDFRHYCHTQHPKAGGLWTWGGVYPNRIVALFTQEAAYDHGARAGKASVHNVNHALRARAKAAQQEGWTSLALPRLATGVGGLGWAEVKPLIEQQLGELDITVIVYETYRPGEKGDEGLPARAA